MNKTFADQLNFGREIEKCVSRWLMKRGESILPVYDYSGLAEDKAPKLTNLHSSDSLVLPDLLGFRMGRGMWFEVKFKDSANFTRITGRLETGISKRLWDQYWRVAAISGLPVWLIFAHKKENEIRAGSLGMLQHKCRFYEGGKMGRCGMVFFPYDSLILLSKYSDVVIGV